MDRRRAHGYGDSGWALQDPLQSWTSGSRLCLDVSGCWHEVVAVPGQPRASSAWHGGAQVVLLAPGPAGEESLDFILARVPSGKTLCWLLWGFGK